MKNILKILVILTLLVGSIPLSAFNFDQQPTPSQLTGVNFRIKNDTGSTIRLYDGRGHFSILSSTVSSRRTVIGTKYFISEHGSKGAFLFEVKPSFRGKTIRLSDYI